MAGDTSKISSGTRELTSQGVLLVDREPSVHRGMVQLLAPAGVHLTAVKGPDEALELLAGKFFAVVIIDLDTPASNAGRALIRRVHEASPLATILALAARKSFESTVNAFRAGADDVIMKAPDQVGYLKERVIAAIDEASARGAKGSLLAEVGEAMDEFLKRLLDSERRALELADRLEGREFGGEGAEKLTVLVVDDTHKLYQALETSGRPGFAFQLALTGGEALDRVTSTPVHFALVGERLPDLPGSMVVRALKAQAPDVMVISFVMGGPVQIVETSRSIPVVAELTDAAQITERLGELAAARHARLRERRALQVFREHHKDFLKRFAELRRRCL